MTLLVRFIAVLTALLCFGVMGVSAYAARMEPGPAHVPGLPPDAVPVPALAEQPDDGVPPRVSAWAAATATAQARSVRPTPTVALRYAAPQEAAPVLSTRRSRDNLSFGTRVWSVPSLKPGAGGPVPPALGVFEIPPEQLVVMQQVSAATSIPWQVFGAIAKAESDLGNNMSTSSAGAIGYGQFLPEMWEIYGNAGDPYDYRDVIPAMGRFLLDAGAPADLSNAVYAYNHSWPYVAQVLSYAASYGYGYFGSNWAGGLDTGLIWPVIGPISSDFGPEHPLGIDIDQTMAVGTAVRAAHDGVVLFAGGDACCSYGYYVILLAPSGLTTLYGHFDQLWVATGQAVRQGDALGIVGSTGFSTGTHLHFEVMVNGQRQDPIDYLP